MESPSIDAQAVQTLKATPGPLLSVLQRAGFDLIPDGHEYIDATHDSLTVFQSKRDHAWRFKWFAKDEAGDVFAAARIYLGAATFPDQYRVAAGISAGAPQPIVAPPAAPLHHPVEPLDVVAARAAARLPNSRAAMDYLTRDRGLWPEMIEMWGLGVHEWYSKQAARTIPCIAIPVVPPGTSEPSAIRLRLLEPATRSNGTPLRYVSVYGSQSSFCPLIVRAPTADHPLLTIVVGGEFKAFSLMQHLIEASGAHETSICPFTDVQILSPAGESIWNMSWLRHILTPRVICIPDPDDAGRAFVAKVLHTCVRAHLLPVPPRYLLPDGRPAKIDDAIALGYRAASALEDLL